MKAISSSLVRGLPVGSLIDTCDNSGAKVVRIFTVKGLKTKKGRMPAAAIGDIVVGSVVKGRPDMRKQVVFGIIVRQRKEYKRPDGTRIKFEDNAIIVLKDDKGNPKGTLFKGAIAKEACERWPAVAKLARIIV
jgi:large subunit ribosomal protein L14